MRCTKHRNTAVPIPARLLTLTAQTNPFALTALQTALVTPGGTFSHQVVAKQVHSCEYP